MLGAGAAAKRGDRTQCQRHKAILEAIAKRDPDKVSRTISAYAGRILATNLEELK
jgi:DNA-binding FadR family transcriptional regulator